MADTRKADKTQSPAKPTAVQVRPQTWVDPGTWSASFKFLPAYIILVVIFIAVYYNNFISHPSIDLSSYESCVGSFNYSFRVNAALTQAHDWSKHNWEVATAYEATMEIYNPERSVFSRSPFPDGKLPKLGMRLDEASIYVEHKINRKGKALNEDEISSGLASLGVAALMFGQKWNGKDYLTAAERQKNILLNEAPRHSNGAISSSLDSIQLSSDAVAMIPPFLAYYGVATNDLDLIREAVRQITLYRDVLLNKERPKEGLWRHTVGPEDVADEGAWSTGNAWAAHGMAKVRATISSWPTSNATMAKEISNLDSWIHELFQGVVRTDDDSSGLLRNYLGEDTWEGETSGTSLLTATAYRMGNMNPAMFRHLRSWANSKRRAVIQRVDNDGIVKPAADPLKPNSREPVEISPVGESFLLLLGTAWRDCVCSENGGTCLIAYLGEMQVEPAKEISFESITGVSLQSLLSYPKTQWTLVKDYFKGPGSLPQGNREL